jgi:hypothetical protein
MHALDVDRATQRVHGTCKQHQQPLASRPCHPATVFLDLGLNELTVMGIQLSEGALVVSAYQAAVSGYIRHQNGHQPSLDLCRFVRENFFSASSAHTRPQAKSMKNLIIVCSSFPTVRDAPTVQLHRAARVDSASTRITGRVTGVTRAQVKRDAYSIGVSTRLCRLKAMARVCFSSASLTIMPVAPTESAVDARA